MAARVARPQLSGLFARAMGRQRVIGVPRTTPVRSCIIDGDAAACGGDGLSSFDHIRRAHLFSAGRKRGSTRAIQGIGVLPGT